MIPLKEVGIPIEIRNLNSPIETNAPTIIGPNIIQSGEIKAIGCMRSISCITAQSGDIENQSKKLGQVLIELDNKNITCWSIKSNPSSVDIVVSQQQSTLAQKIISKSFPVSNTTNHSCLISFIGTDDKNLVDKKIDYVKRATAKVSYLNCTELSVQYIADTLDIKKLMKELSQVLVKNKTV
jgi:aspartokinase